MNIASDNVAGASPEVLAALSEANEGSASSYGADAWTERAEALLAETFERDVAVFLVATGTAANALALACLCPPWGAVLTHAESHIMMDECGAPESFTGGAKLIGLAGSEGKITPDALGAALERLPRGVQHSVQASVVSLSQVTEAGTLYGSREIAALTDLAHRHGLAVHMDGARFANAVVAADASPADLTWRAGVDVLSLGFTKGGALAAEAVVFFDPARTAEMPYRRKRGGHLVSKGRFLGAQIAAMLEEGHWLDLARHANARARQLRDGLAQAGVRFAAPVEANELFPVLPRALHDHLKGAGAVFHEWSSPGLRSNASVEVDEVLARLVTSWSTTEAAIESFLHEVRRAGALV